MAQLAGCTQELGKGKRFSSGLCQDSICIWHKSFYLRRVEPKGMDIADDMPEASGLAQFLRRFQAPVIQP